ncbi:MAG TPA: TPM domain-containing protein, partial [Pyrinomonadaceae bacterium]
MKRKLLPTALFTAASILFAAFTSFARDINTSPLPAPTGFVNDYAGVLDASTKQQLEAKLKNLKETSNPSVEIAVAIVKTTGDKDIFDYSLAVARGWKIGSKQDDNPSALLFIAIDDRKYFTQVSRDLEGDLPDGAVGTIQRQYLVPEFKKQNYGKGISDTLDAYIMTIRNKGNAPVAATTPTPRGSSAGVTSVPFGSIFCCGIFVLVLILGIFSRRHGGGGRGGWGG